LQAGGHRFDPDWLHQLDRPLPAETSNHTVLSVTPLRRYALFKNPEVLFLTLSFQANVFLFVLKMSRSQM
jgi:hypothetical protein